MIQDDGPDDAARNSHMQSLMRRSKSSSPKKRITEPTMLKTTALSALSGMQASFKFSFGKADRFASPHGSPSKSLARSKSLPAWSGHTSTTASDAGGLADDSAEISEEPSHILSGAGGACSSQEPMDSASCRHPRPPATDRLFAPRFEGSFDRLGAHRQHPGQPRAKSYDPAIPMGPGTSPYYNHSPQFSMGGGPSRMPDFDSKQRYLADLTKKAAKQMKQTSDKQRALTLMDLKDAASPKRKPKPPLARGFGSETRCSSFGGPTCSPGPGNYQIARDCDPKPQWQALTYGPQCLWGDRTAGRQSMKVQTSNPTNIGPGDAIADHPFKPGGPSPIFGHPAKDIAQPNFPGQDPSAYTMPNSLCKSVPNYSIGRGQRPELLPPSQSPGPIYHPNDDYCHQTTQTITFSVSQRQHPCELVDPDEPPGPGAHNVRRDPKPTDKPSAGLSRAQRLKEGLGLGPAGPGPGAAFQSVPSSLDKRGVNMAAKLPRSVEVSPGPHDTAGQNPSSTDLATRQSAPIWATISNRTSVRKPPWRIDTDTGPSTMTSAPQFVPTGPKWTFVPKRDPGASRKHSGHSHSEAMVAITSMG